MLLIEFDEDQPFSLLEETTDDITDNSIHTKLILLVKTFPTLKYYFSFIFSFLLSLELFGHEVLM